MNGARDRFTGQRGRVERGIPFDHCTVKRDPFARIDHDRLSDLHFFRIDFFELSVYFDIGKFGTDVHQGRDRLARLIDRIGLEPFADLIKQHDSDRFAVFSQRQGTDRCQGHQEIFIKNLSVHDISARFYQYII